MDYSDLSSDEQLLVDALLDGRPADFSSGSPGPHLRGEVLLSVLTGQLARDGTSTPAPVRGLRVTGAIFDDLDLSRLGVADRPLVSLEFEDCDFGAINLDQSTGCGLSLTACRFSHLSGRHVTMRSRVCFQSLGAPGPGRTAAGSAGARCSIDLSNALIEGALEISQSFLSLPVELREARETDHRRKWALNLGATSVRGNVVLEPSTTVSGGCLLDGASVAGNLIARGVVLEDHEFAMKAGNARIDGWVFLGPAPSGPDSGRPVRATGTLDLFGIRCNGLSFTGVEIASPPGSKLGHQVAINLPYAQVEHHVHLDAAPGRASQIAGAIVASHARVGGLTLSGPQVGLGMSAEVGGTAVYANGLKAGGPVELSSRCDGGIDLTGAVIAGDLILGGTVRGRLDCSGSGITGSVRIGDDAGPLRFDVAGGGRPALSFENATIGRALVVNRELTPTGGLSPKDVKRTLGENPGDRILDAKSLALGCYPGWSLYDLTIAHPDATAAGTSLLAKPGEPPLLLTGDASVLHGLNASGHLQLKGAEQVLEYLRLFTLHVWAPSGGFVVVTRDVLEMLDEEGDVLLDPAIEERGEVYEVRNCAVFYANHFFRSDFAVRRDGNVEMLRDEPLRPALSVVAFKDYQRRYRSARQEGLEPFPLRAVLPGRWDEAELKLAQGLLRRAVQRDDFPRIDVSLRNCTLGVLEDERGLAWGLNARFVLDGISVGRVLEVTRGKRFGSHERQQLMSQLRRSGGDGQADKAGTARAAGFSAASVARAALWAPARLIGFALRILFRLAWAVWRSIVWPALQWIADVLDPLLGRASHAWLSRRTSRVPPPSIIGVHAFEKFFHGGYGLGHGLERWSWLMLQYDRYAPLTGADYRPQPFREFTRVYWQQGQVQEFRGITSGQRRIEQRLARFPVNLGWWLYSVSCDYGLRPGRAIAFMLACILAGAGLVQQANDRGMLVVDASPTATLVTEGAPGEQAEPALQRAAPGDALTEVPCGTQIVPFLFAADVFLPLVDLRQEMRCQIRATRTSPPVVAPAGASLAARGRAFWAATARDPLAWSVGLAIYALLGWIVTSVVVLTITIAVRQHLLLLSGD